LIVVKNQLCHPQCFDYLTLTSFSCCLADLLKGHTVSVNKLFLKKKFSRLAYIIWYRYVVFYLIFLCTGLNSGPALGQKGSVSDKLVSQWALAISHISRNS